MERWKGSYVYPKILQCSIKVTTPPRFSSLCIFVLLPSFVLTFSQSIKGTETRIVGSISGSSLNRIVYFNEKPSLEKRKKKKGGVGDGGRVEQPRTHDATNQVT